MPETTDNYDRPMYGLYGGSSYAMPHHPSHDPGAASEWYDTLEGAWIEWKRRRSDWTGRYLLWGDGGPDDTAVYVSDGTGTHDAWTPRDLCAEPFDSIDFYYD